MCKSSTVGPLCEAHALHASSHTAVCMHSMHSWIRVAHRLAALNEGRLTCLLAYLLTYSLTTIQSYLLTYSLRLAALSEAHAAEVSGWLSRSKETERLLSVERQSRAVEVG